VYSVIAYDGTKWTIFDTRYLAAGSAVTFPVGGASRVELIVDHRPASLFDTTSWNVDANAAVGSADSWSFDQVPSGTALKFGYVITAPRTVVVNVPLAATSLTFDNVNRYTLAGAGTVIVSSGIAVLRGSHKIAAPLAFAAPVALSIAAGGSLDIAGNTLLLSTPVATLRQYLRDGRLFSSNALADPGHDLALAYLVDSATDAITVKTTFYGDANLDGAIDADDYALLDRGFAAHAGTWQAGDFDYDGQVTSADYLLIDRAFFDQAQGFGPGFLAMREAQFGGAYVSALLASVPEPSLVACVVVLPMLARRRRG
jgi:hypothetical protein